LAPPPTKGGGAFSFSPSLVAEPSYGNLAHITPEHRDIVWTITYALWEHQRRLPRPGKRSTGWPPGVEEFEPMAELIVEHLKRSGVRFDKGSAGPGHGIPQGQ
jgi:hypothetical protein